MVFGGGDGPGMGSGEGWLSTTMSGLQSSTGVRLRLRLEGRLERLERIGRPGSALVGVVGGVLKQSVSGENKPWGGIEIFCTDIMSESGGSWKGC